MLRNLEFACKSARGFLRAQIKRPVERQIDHELLSNVNQQRARKMSQMSEIRCVLAGPGHLRPCRSSLGAR